jgi:nitrogenase molybdenum-iron protein NifN
MAQIIRYPKALAINPLKASAPAGAALAFLGMQRAMPMFHGSQGCTAFAKVLFVRHFREPIALQTTAMDQIATVMSADENAVEALATVCAKSKPSMVGLITTALSETQGTDIARLVREFRTRYPQFERIPVVPVNAPDFSGCLETGYADAVSRILEVTVPDTASSPLVGQRKRQINLLLGPSLTPGDVEAIQEWVEAFGLRPVCVPNLADSLDGHLIPEDFTPVTLGGTPPSELATLGQARATVVIGPSLFGAGDALQARTGVPTHRFDSLMGLEACDAFTAFLADVSGQEVPQKLERARAQLQDAMVDTHFMMGLRRVAIAADPDLLHALARLFESMGSEIVAAVSPVRAPVLASMPCAEVRIGDLDDLETLAQEKDAEFLVGNAHLGQAAQRLGLPWLRAGLPQYDHVGAHCKTWVGYKGTRQTLFDVANLVLEHHSSITPHRSCYAVRNDPPPASFAAASH